MASDVDEQPPSRPLRAQPDAPRRRPPSRSELKAAQRRATAPPARRTRPPAPPSRRPPVDDDVEAEGGEPAPAPRSQTRTVVLMSVLTAVVVLAGIFAIVQSRSKSDRGPQAAAPAEVPTTTFRDAETGFTVAYPRSWRRVEVPVAEYRLALDGGSNVAFTVRVVPIQTPADTTNLANFKAVTDGLVASNPTVTILKQQAISLNGMLGYYYFYTFNDGAVQAVHAHYFLFSGHKMNILVFQTLPDDFQAMAGTFDKIAESFRSDPNVPSAPSTTAASNTTTTVK